jgi:TRAP-type mannitol/chloroaromatic compound transport system permease large subunit
MFTAKHLLSIAFIIILVLGAVLLILGMFVSVIAAMMITIPIMFPIIEALGFEPVRFGLLLLPNIEMASTSLPYGLNLYVMKGVAPPDTKMGDIFRAAVPFLICDLAVMALMIAFGDDRFLFVVRSLFFLCQYQKWVPH